PVEIGKRLERAMLAHQQVSVNAKLVPNAYEVRLNPNDYAQFANAKEGLSRQLESALAETAARHDFTALDRIRVTLVEDPEVGARQPYIIAEMTDRSHHSQPDAHRHPSPGRRPPARPRAADQTGVIDIPSSTSATGMQLTIETGRLAGQTFPLPHGRTTIGR